MGEFLVNGIFNYVCIFDGLEAASVFLYLAENLHLVLNHFDFFVDCHAVFVRYMVLLFHELVYEEFMSITEIGHLLLLVRGRMPIRKLGDNLVPIEILRGWLRLGTLFLELLWS